jgi:hypothetical protein
MAHELQFPGHADLAPLLPRLSAIILAFSGLAKTIVEVVAELGALLPGRGARARVVEIIAHSSPHCGGVDGASKSGPVLRRVT